MGSQEPRYRIRNEEVAHEERIVVERHLRNHQSGERPDW